MGAGARTGARCDHGGKRAPVTPSSEPMGSRGGPRKPLQSPQAGSDERTEGAKAPHEAWTLVYHVPRSQVWEGSRGRASGCVHLTNAAGWVQVGRIDVPPGRALCKKPPGWYEREDHGERRCPECVRRAERHGITWPGDSA